MNINSKMSGTGLYSRKWLTGIGVFIVISVFLWFEKIDMGVFERLTMLSVGGYLAANAITKFANRGGSSAKESK